MPSVIRISSALVGGAFVVSAIACKPKVTARECDTLLERYARLVVVQAHPDASAEQISAEEQRERTEARGDDAFKNCRSEVSRSEFDCAMKAESADALEKCLE